MTATGRVTASPHPPSRRRDFGQWGLCSARLRLVFLLDQACAAIGGMVGATGQSLKGTIRVLHWASRTTSCSRVGGFSVTLVALLWTGAVAAGMPDELKPDELADRLYQECGEQWGFHGPIARCVLEKEEAFGKEP
jgi:hypothetical protein